MNLDKIKYQKNKVEEKKPRESGVFEVDGEFFLYSSDADDFVKIPKDVYRIVRAGLYLEERSKRDRGEE